MPKRRHDPRPSAEPDIDEAASRFTDAIPHLGDELRRTFARGASPGG